MEDNYQDWTMDQVLDGRVAVEAREKGESRDAELRAAYRSAFKGEGGTQVLIDILTALHYPTPAGQFKPEEYVFGQRIANMILARIGVFDRGIPAFVEGLKNM